MNVYLDTHIWVPAEAIDVERMKSDLTIKNLSVEQKIKYGTKLAKGEELFVEMWETREDFPGYYGLPRGYLAPWKPGVTDRRIVDLRSRGKMQWGDQSLSTSLRFHLGLRDAQKAAISALIASSGDNLICLGCGKGKTIGALWYANWRRAKTIILVDREFLADQWTSAIQKCFWLPRSAVGRIQANKFNIGTRFTIAVMQTLARRDYDQSFFDQFDLVIPDECHTVAAPTFREVLPRFSCERLGLTATPKRRDGLHPLVMYHLGGLEPVYTDVSRERSCTWFFKHLPREILSPAIEASCFRRVPGSLRYNRYLKREEWLYALNRPKYETAACNSLMWDQILRADIEKAVAAERNVIVLGGRTEHLTELVASLEKAGISAGLVIGKVKNKDRLGVFRDKQVICATWQLAMRALDVPRLDTLMLLFPSDDPVFLQQASGRIEDRSQTGTKNSMVVTYCHDALDRPYRERKKKGKTEKMIEILQSIDPGATIKHVKA